MSLSIPGGGWGAVATGNSASSSSLSLALPGSGGLLAGDVLLIQAVAERAEIPTLTLSNGAALSTIRSEAHTDLSVRFSWRRLSSADLSATIRMANTAARRQALGWVVVRQATDPQFVNQAFDGAQGGTGVSTKNGPSFVVPGDPVIAVSLWAVAASQAPYTGRTITTEWAGKRYAVAAGYTGGINPAITCDGLLITAANGQANNGESITVSGGSYESLNTLAVFQQQGAAATPPTVVAKTVPGTIIDATGSAPGQGGTITYTISPTTAVTTLSPGVWSAAPTVQTTYTITGTESGTGLKDTAQVTVTPPSGGGTTSGRVNSYRSNGSGWTTI